MKRRALVLGGGGTVGIAWESGVAVGLLEHGVDLAAADLFVGTSAGSVVGTYLAFGFDPRQVLEVQRATAAAEQRQAEVLDPAGLEAIYTRWTSATVMDRETRREIGGMALKARTMVEDDWVTRLSQVTGIQPEWPQRALRITGVEAETGEPAIWDRSSGVPLHLAVAASCTVPGLFPPVTIGGRRFIDGGVRSGTNADLAEGYETVVVIAPMGSELHPLGHRQVLAEAERLRAGGASVEIILPDARTRASFGPSMMDQTRVVDGADQGVRQGLELGARLAQVWN